MVSIRDKLKPYTEIPKLKDRDVFIIGSGTSVNRRMVAYIEDNDLGDVISVNASILLCNSGYFISNDSALMNHTYWEDIKKSKCTKIVRNSWEKHLDKIPYDFYYFWPRECGELIIDKYSSDNGLCYVSSIPTAIDFSIFLEARKIYLLGVDHYTVNGKSYFWEMESYNGVVPKTKGHFAPVSLQNFVFNKNIKIFNELKKYADDKNIEIVNLNENSKIDSFRKLNFNELIIGVKNGI